MECEIECIESAAGVVRGVVGRQPNLKAQRLACMWLEGRAGQDRQCKNALLILMVVIHSAVCYNITVTPPVDLLTTPALPAPVDDLGQNSRQLTTPQHCSPDDACFFTCVCSSLSTAITRRASTNNPSSLLHEPQVRTPPVRRHEPAAAPNDKSKVM